MFACFQVLDPAPVVRQLRLGSGLFASVVVEVEGEAQAQHRVVVLVRQRRFVPRPGERVEPLSSRYQSAFVLLLVVVEKRELASVRVVEHC